MSHREHAVFSHCRSLCQASWDAYIFLNPVLAASLILNSVIQLYELSRGKDLFLPQPSSPAPQFWPNSDFQKIVVGKEIMTNSALGKPTNCS